MADKPDIRQQTTDAAHKAMNPEAPPGYQEDLDLIGGRPLSGGGEHQQAGPEVPRWQAFRDQNEQALDQEGRHYDARDSFSGWADMMGFDPALPETRHKYDQQVTIEKGERLQGSELYPRTPATFDEERGLTYEADERMQAQGHDVTSSPRDFSDEEREELLEPSWAELPRPPIPTTPQGQVRSGPITLGSAMEEYPGLEGPAALRTKISHDLTPASAGQRRSAPWGSRDHAEDIRAGDDPKDYK